MDIEDDLNDILQDWNIDMDDYGDLLKPSSDNGVSTYNKNKTHEKRLL